ncbi:MAG: glucose-1-phosphate adenylyltransferase subunit GlgD [Ruminococcus sp.]|nr:glucose-1-phosphate adenylyltransferase subunit GlgD [Ruminococcus sp.]
MSGRSNNVLGLIFANTNEDSLSQLTAKRTMASVPFGGKYRLIDFPLSNMSNAGINNVGIIASSNYFSLMDHVGSGHAWDLSKRKSGVTILPPFSGKSFDNALETIETLHGYIENRDETDVLICHTNAVANLDYQKMYYQHVKKGADITFCYKYQDINNNKNYPMVADIDDDGRINRLQIRPQILGDCNLITGSILIRKDLLMSIVRECVATNNTGYRKLFLDFDLNKYKVFGYEHKGYLKTFCSMQDYYSISMDLMDGNVRKDLFNPERPIYTKVRDDRPSRYGFDCSVKGSLIAQGCEINGSVENSIISKGVVIGKNVSVKNCIIMQDSVIGENATISNVIIDKDCYIADDQQLMGAPNYPVYIEKGSIIS